MGAAIWRLDQEAAGKGNAITSANPVLTPNHLCYYRIDCDNDNGNGNDLRSVQAPRKFGKYLMEQCQIADTPLYSEAPHFVAIGLRVKTQSSID
jgi:hypothetical protein